jgi:hypothetical protein
MQVAAEEATRKVSKLRPKNQRND